MRGSLGFLATRLMELVVLLGWMPTGINAFSILPSEISSRLVLRSSHYVTLSMGRYDKPFPLPSEDEFTVSPVEFMNSTNHNDKAPPKPMKRLFSFRFDGTEKNDFLPCLSRSLDSGLAPLVPLTDGNVQKLATDVGCLPEDAAWALEACRGDMAEATTRIWNAQKMNLEERNGPQQTAPSTKVSANQVLGQFREQLKKQEQTRRRVEYFSGGTPDADWLPVANPKPVDDEPWFTG